MTCHFLRVSSLREGSAGATRTDIVYTTEIAYEDRHILLLDDIIDTGITLNFLLDHIRERRPRSLKVAALIDKPGDRKIEVQVDWAAFTLKEPVGGAVPRRIRTGLRGALSGAALHRDHPAARTSRARGARSASRLESGGASHSWVGSPGGLESERNVQDGHVVDVAAGGHLPGLAFRPDPEEGDLAEVQRVHDPGRDAGQVQDATIVGYDIKGHFTSREPFRTTAPPDFPDYIKALLAKKVQVTVERDQTPAWANMLISWAPVPAPHRLLGLLHEADAERRQQGALLRQVQGQAARLAAEEGHVQGRGRRGRGQGRAAGDHRVPARAPEVPEAGRPHPQGRAPHGPPGNGQDAPRPRHRRRGQRALLLHLRLGLRRDVRGRGRLARARPVRAGQEERPLHHLHRRDRRRRPPPRGRASAAGTTSASRP